MKSFLRASLALIVGPLVHFSGAETPTAAGPQAAKPPAGSVWVAKSDQGGRLYLCGTIHILRAKDYPLAPAYEAAYADSQRLIFELPPGASHGSDLSQRMQKAAALPAGTTLEKLVGTEIEKAVIQWTQQHHLSPDAILRYQPWYIALLMAAVEYGSLGAEPDRSVDQFFETRAARDKKPGEGLETVDFQIGLFSKLTADQQRDLLKQTLAEVKTLPDEYARLIEAWKNGDLDALHEMLYREAKQFPELMDLFLHDRNKAWLDRLEACLKKGEHVMLLVGTGHFAGKQGLIALLKARGYIVEHCPGTP